MVIWLFALKDYIVLATIRLCEGTVRMRVNKGRTELDHLG
jgi:hypothetical protein